MRAEFQMLGYLCSVPMVLSSAGGLALASLSTTAMQINKIIHGENHWNLLEKQLRQLKQNKTLQELALNYCLQLLSLNFILLMFFFSNFFFYS